MRERPRPIRLISSKERMGEYSRCYMLQQEAHQSGSRSRSSISSISSGSISSCLRERPRLIRPIRAAAGSAGAQQSWSCRRSAAACARGLD